MPYADLEQRRIYHREYMRQYRAANKNDVNKKAAIKYKEYRVNNWDKIKSGYYKWRKENKIRWAEIKRKAEYRRPIFTSLSEYFVDEIKLFYRVRPIGFHVDHIVPLNNEFVCGLHVPWNLQYLLAKDNMSKGNKFG